MSNFRNRFFVTLALVFSAVPAVAYDAAEGKVNAIFGPFFYQTDFRGTPSGTKSPWMNDYGLIAQGDVNEKGALEIGLFHMNKIFFRDYEGGYFAQKTQLIYVTMGYRWWLSKLYSASLALHTSYALGDPGTVEDTVPTGVPRPDTSATIIAAYGIDLSLQSELWSSGRYSVLLDTRYAASLTRRIGENANHYGVMVGLKYLIQEKDPTRSESENEPVNMR